MFLACFYSLYFRLTGEEDASNSEWKRDVNALSTPEEAEGITTLTFPPQSTFVAIIGLLPLRLLL